MNVNLSYTDQTKPQISIPEFGVDESTSLNFQGYSSLRYSTMLNNALLNITENFSSEFPPRNPTEGQVWFNSVEKALNIFDGSSFVHIEIIHFGSAQPNEPGPLWYDTNEHFLKMYNENTTSYIPLADNYFHNAGTDYDPSEILTGPLTVDGTLQILDNAASFTGEATVSEQIIASVALIDAIEFNGGVAYVDVDNRTIHSQHHIQMEAIHSFNITRPFTGVDSTPTLSDMILRVTANGGTAYRSINATGHNLSNVTELSNASAAVIRKQLYDDYQYILSGNKLFGGSSTNPSSMSSNQTLVITKSLDNNGAYDPTLELINLSGSTSPRLQINTSGYFFQEDNRLKYRNLLSTDETIFEINLSNFTRGQIDLKDKMRVTNVRTGTGRRAVTKKWVDDTAAANVPSVSSNNVPKFWIAVDVDGWNWAGGSNHTQGLLSGGLTASNVVFQTGSNYLRIVFPNGFPYDLRYLTLVSSGNIGTPPSWNQGGMYRDNHSHAQGGAAGGNDGETYTDSPPASPIITTVGSNYIDVVFQRTRIDYHWRDSDDDDTDHRLTTRFYREYFTRPYRHSGDGNYVAYHEQTAKLMVIMGI